MDNCGHGTNEILQSLLRNTPMVGATVAVAVAEALAK